MKAAKSFREILAIRGQIVIFTASASVGLSFEQYAERQSAHVVTTRGWADPYGPLSEWHRVWASREYAVFSADQRRYVKDFRLPATDIVWVGETGDQLLTPHVWVAFNRGMARANCMESPTAVRKWLIAEDAL